MALLRAPFFLLLLASAQASLYPLRDGARPGVFLPLLLLLLLASVQASLYPLRDGARPGVASDRENSPLAWWDGGPAFVLASAGAVRVNFRAVYTYPPASLVRPLDALGWHGVPCNASAWALCSSDVGRALPYTLPRMPERIEAVTADGWRDLGCTQSQDKRLVSLGVYDISACDILDEGLDLVYTQGMLYHRHNTLHTWMYWSLVVVALVLVRSLSFNLHALWEPEQPVGGDDKKKENSRGATMLASVAALVAIVAVLVHTHDIRAWTFWATVATALLLLWALVHNLRNLDVPVHHPQATPLVASVAALAIIVADGDTLFITSADQVFYWSTFVYVLVYIAMHAARMWLLPRLFPQEEAKTGSRRECPVYNVIVATLQLVASRLYASADTPYNLVLITVLATRVW
jgi:hypothetical protein